MQVYRASKEHLNTLAPLFDSYRVFYKQPSSEEAAKAFLQERFSQNDSVIFIAIAEDGRGLGFTQLYPSLSSVSMQRTYILNDLFVISSARGKGVGAALMERAKEFAITQNAKGLTLETDSDNPARFLYERLGWERDTEVFHYTWKA